MLRHRTHFCRSANVCNVVLCVRLCVHAIVQDNAQIAVISPVLYVEMGFM